MTFRLLKRWYHSHISTHTPVRVWRYWSWPCQLACHFNSHTREGVTIIACNNAVKIRFQLTHPWGCDKILSDIWIAATEFQLTHPWGCDFFKVRFPFIDFLFQLTHPWGCDPATIEVDGFVYISTHTPVRVWQVWWQRYFGSSQFQLTHPWGCDLHVCLISYRL